MGSSTLSQSVAYITQAFRIQPASPPTQAENSSIQSRWVRWTPNAGRQVPYWTRRPTTQDAWDLLTEYMGNELVPVQKVYSVSHLAQGHFNTLFKVSHEPESLAGTGRETLPKEFVMRLKMPWCPYFGVENEAATLAFAGEEGVPVPRVFCFDSSTNNTLGLNCMFMELINMAENNWEEVDDYLSRFGERYPARLEPIARTTQEYMHRLAERRGTFSGIGSLYATFETGQRERRPWLWGTESESARLDFYLGPLLDWSLWAPKHGMEPSLHARGPFVDCFDYFDALIDAVDLGVSQRQSETWERLPFDRLPDRAQGLFLAKELVAAARARHEGDERARKTAGTHTFEARLVHHDLHGGNILVDAQSGRVAMLLDWESADTRPAALTRGELKCLASLRDHADFWKAMRRGNQVSYRTGLRCGWGPRDLGCWDTGPLATQALFVYKMALGFMTWGHKEERAVATHIRTLERRGFHRYQKDGLGDFIQEILASGSDGPDSDRGGTAAPRGPLRVVNGSVSPSS